MNSMQQNLYICMLNLNTKYQMYRKQHKFSPLALIWERCQRPL